MKKRANRRLDAVFGALSDPIRRNILSRLARGECSVTTLGEPFDVSAPAITKHLRVLESAGLIARRKEGRVNYCCLSGDPLGEADDWIQQQRKFWEQQLDALEKYLEKEKGACSDLSKEPDLPSGSKDVSKRRGKKFSTRGRNRKR
jgi:DNA-binding transcriptional ArsR family regulator